MPYIYCETCGAGYYNNVLSCPACGARVRSTRTHPLAVAHRHRRRSNPPLEDVEDEVRQALYGWHSGCVERCREELA